MPNWKEALVFVWALVVFSPALGDRIDPNTQWFATLLLVPLLAACPPRLRDLRGLPGLPAAAGLVAALLLAAFSSADPAQSLLHAAKLAVVLLVVYPFLLSSPRLARAAFFAAVAAACLNFACLLLTMGSLAELAGMRGAGRWHTVLNGRGSLACLGGLIFGHAVYGALASRRWSWARAALPGVSLTLLALDGNRAVALSLFAISGFLIYELQLKSGGAARAAPALLRLAAAGLAVTAAWQTLPGAWRDPLAELPPTERLAAFWDYRHSASLSEYLENLDPTRYSGLLEALDAIAEHPLAGGGLGSTVSLDVGKASVVHNAYLQSWADLGLLAAISFLALSLGWVPSLPRALRRLRALRSASERALYYGAVCGLFLFCGLSLFHPLSVQISVWAFFVIPAALYAQLLGPRAAPRLGGSSPRESHGV